MDIRKINDYTDQMLELINDSEELTQSDLQGAAMALVTKIMQGA